METTLMELRDARHQLRAFMDQSGPEPLVAICLGLAPVIHPYT
jgi:hypothetical protein